MALPHVLIKAIDKIDISLMFSYIMHVTNMKFSHMNIVIILSLGSLPCKYFTN